MNIRCPRCATSYTVPKGKIGEKPRKMRCSKCKEVFTVTRRDASTPDGYEEFTGKQDALPDEFAFLRSASWRKRSSAPPANDDQEPSTSAAAAAVEKEPPAQEPNVVEKVLTQADRKSVV
jgi:predicted Zn finger-like uncharacterized protein